MTDQKRKSIDKGAGAVVELPTKQAIINRLYGHRQSLRGILAETERIIEWLQKPDK